MVTVLQLRCEDPEHTFLSPQELAESLGFPLSRLTGWRKNGGGPEFVKFGKTVAYRVSAVNAWVDEHSHRMIGDRPTHTRRQR